MSMINRKPITRIDRELYKRYPDQMIARLNEIIDRQNGSVFGLEIEQRNGNSVIIIGNQPITAADPSPTEFGIVMWEKNGDFYSNPMQIS